MRHVAYKVGRPASSTVHLMGEPASGRAVHLAVIYGETSPETAKVEEAVDCTRCQTIQLQQCQLPTLGVGSAADRRLVPTVATIEATANCGLAHWAVAVATDT